jgi:hypothetical protein
MPEYTVRWEIDLDADSAYEAARKALAIQRDPRSTANVFTVVRYWHAPSYRAKSRHEIVIDLDREEVKHES